MELQIGEETLEAMLTVGVVVALTVTVMLLLFAVVELKQFAFDVSTHDTTCPLVKVFVVNDDEVAPPTLDPLIRHW